MKKKSETTKSIKNYPVCNELKKVMNYLSFSETMQEGVATLQIQISKQTSNSSDAEDTSINLFISEFQQIQTRIDTLELIANTHDTDLSHLETVTNVHGERLENITDQTADLQSNISAVSTALELRMTTTTEEIKANLTSQGVILATLNDTVMKLILLTNELSNSSQTESAQLVQLEADMNSSEAMFQEIASRVIDFESNITADRALVLSLQTEMANMQANLTSATQLIKTHGDIIFTINKTVIQMVGVINQSNNNSQAAEELIADLEAKIESKLLQIKSDIEANRGNVKENTDKIKLLEANVTSEKDKSEILSSNITYLETEIGTVKAAIQNNDAGIINNSDKIRLFNYSVTAHMDIAKTLRSNVTDLELEIGTLKAAIQSNNNAIACSVTNIAELDNSTSESISKLANSLIDVTGN